MKTRLPWFISLTALVALLCCVPPAAAYWPPCQNVTGPTVSADGTKVEFSVYNPATGETVPGFCDIPSGYTVGQLAQNQGIVSWRFVGINTITWFATYDPVLGWRIDGYIPNLGYSLHSIQDGVVWYEEIYTEGADKYSHHLWVTYDPGLGRWGVISINFFAPIAGGGIIKGYYSKNGVVAVHHNLTASSGDQIVYLVYDPTRTTWKYGAAGGAAADVIQYVSIDDYGGIHYNLNGTGYKKGYSVTDGAWQDGYGELCAAFVAQPVSGNAPLTVWVTDMSLGAWAGGIGVTFAYDWGDGASSPNLRSGFHTYTGFNRYTLSHTVTRGRTVTYESDTRTTQIITDVSPPTGGSITINNGAPYTNNSTVTLNLAVSDNSGSWGYRVRNQGDPWPDIWAFGGGTITYWPLIAGEGPRTVNVQFRDLAGNIIGTGDPGDPLISDSIIVDLFYPVDGILFAKPGNRQVKLNWGGFYDAISGIQTYRLYYSPSSPPTPGTKIYEGLATTFTHQGLFPGVPCYYRVCAVDGAGNVSPGAMAGTTPAAALPFTGLLLLDD